MSDKPATIALVGAGARGELNLGLIAKRHPQVCRFSAVAELDEQRRERFIDTFNIEKKNAFADWRELFTGPRLADGLINALPCRMHYESTMAALKAGYHVLLEKPMALTPSQSVQLVQTAKKHNRILMIALQCRYNEIYQRMNRMQADGDIGRLMNIDCGENIGYWHFIMSYVRGIHHRSSDSHSFVMAKGVHDIDLLSWFAGAPARRVSSFGELSFFNEENAPPGVPERCTDNCPIESTCEFSAIKQFVKPGKPDLPNSLLTNMSAKTVIDFVRNPRLRTTASVILRDISMENRWRAVRETEQGLCVYRSDNDVVDHQTVSIEFTNGVTASYSLSAFSLIWERMINLHGTKGEIRSADFSGRLELRTFNPGRVRKQRIRYHGIFHGGGDEVLVLQFAQAVRDKGQREILLSGEICLESHLICFAAEQARVTGKVVEMDDFRRQAKAEVSDL